MPGAPYSSPSVNGIEPFVLEDRKLFDEFIMYKTNETLSSFI